MVKEVPVRIQHAQSVAVIEYKLPINSQTAWHPLFHLLF